MNVDFARNLRLLADHYDSVAEVCRRLDLSRFQFDKYMSDRSMPSRQVWMKICDLFGVDAYEIMLPTRTFENVARLEPSRPGGAVVVVRPLEATSTTWCGVRLPTF